MTAQPQQPTKIRLSLENLTRFGLLTAQEIADGTPVHRIASIQDSEAPQAASITTYESDLSPTGSRTEYTLPSDQAPGVTREFALEAAIHKAEPMKTAGLFWPKISKEPSRTVFSLQLSARFRDEAYKTRTTEIMTLQAAQDPEAPESFIVEFASSGAPLLSDLPEMGIKTFVQKIRESLGTKPDAVVDCIRNAQVLFEKQFQTLQKNPALQTRTVQLGQPK